ncbi:hypothetical protein ABT215_11075 [Streptomyces sp900105755]|uniref:hypothetical protein n=1 Tax=Streptomyces sp. 900105755 TaxID=3154389 RepID=UPI00332377EC
MSTSMQPGSTPWPKGTIARYLNLVGATIDVRHDSDGYTQAACTGCPFRLTGDELATHEQAQTHAEKCRALPRPTA